MQSQIRHQTFRMARKSNLYARLRFRQSLAPEITGYDHNANQSSQALQAKFFWPDIYARFDPVPAGALEPEIERQAKVRPTQVKRRRVINLDNPLRDHSYYWLNKNLVMPRIARAINGGTEYPWPEAGITQEKLARHIGGVAMLGILRLLVGAIIVACLVVLGLRLFGAISIPVTVPFIVALLGIGLYRTVRSWRFGDIS